MPRPILHPLLLMLLRPALALLLLALGLAISAGMSGAGESALSHDGRWRAEIAPPARLTIRDAATGRVVKRFEAVTRAGLPAEFEGVYTDPARRQFILPLKGAPEYWLIATDPEAPPVYEGFVHSHEKGMIEALPSSQGLFARRRVRLEGGQPIGALSFRAEGREMTGLTPDGCWQVVVNLYVNREIARIPRKGCAP